MEAGWDFGNVSDYLLTNKFSINPKSSYFFGKNCENSRSSVWAVFKAFLPLVRIEVFCDIVKKIEVFCNKLKNGRQNAGDPRYLPKCRCFDIWCSTY